MFLFNGQKFNYLLHLLTIFLLKLTYFLTATNFPQIEQLWQDVPHLKV